MKYEYFLSYTFHRYMIRTQMFACSVVQTDYKINSSDAIKKIISSLEKQDNTENVVLINFQLLQELPND